jgi:hypothetical protein
MDEQSKTAPKKPERGGFLNSVWLDITGVTVTVASGAVAAWRSINKSFYQNVKIAPEIDAEIKISKASTEKILKEVTDISGTAEKRVHLFSKLKGQQFAHSAEMDRLLEKNYGIKNIFDRARLLRPHQKIEAAVMVGATMTVALGTLATLVGVRKVSRDQKDLEARLNAMDNNGAQR